MASFQGSHADASRARQLAAQRVADRDKFEQQLAVLGEQAAAVSAANIPLQRRFQAAEVIHQNEDDSQQQAEPLHGDKGIKGSSSERGAPVDSSGGGGGGLVTLEEFRKRKFAQLGKAEQQDGPSSVGSGKGAGDAADATTAAAAAAGGDDSRSGAAADAARKLREKLLQDAREREARRARVQRSAKLSFVVDDDDEDDDDDDDTDVAVRGTSAAGARKRRRTEGVQPGNSGAVLKGVVKNPNVETDFLPDRVRDERERDQRERLEGVWREEQDRRKQEVISVPCSYYDGMDHQSVQRVRRGNTVAQLLMMVVQESYRELRDVGVDGVIFVWEDLILPNELSFHDLTLTGATRSVVSSPRAKVPIGEALFDFDTVRKLQQATIVQKSWYERNKFSAPACFWEMFDADKDGEHYKLSQLKRPV